MDEFHIMKYAKMATNILKDRQSDNISKLIAYYHNGGKIKELFKRERKLNYEIPNIKEVQKQCAKKTKKEIIKKTQNKDLNKYYDIYQSELTLQGKKLLKMGLFK